MIRVQKVSTKRTITKRPVLESCGIGSLGTTFCESEHVFWGHFFDENVVVTAFLSWLQKWLEKENRNEKAENLY